MAISKSEQSFIKTAILADPPQRADGRKLQEFRPIALQTGGDVAPLANGSGRVNLGGSEVIVAIKLETEDIEHRDAPQSEEPLGRDGGRVVCTVSWYVDVENISTLISLTHVKHDSSQSAYPNKLATQLDEMSSDLSTMLTSAFSSCLTPSAQLTIVPRKKSWLLNIEALVLADCGNVFDAILIAIHGALWDLRIPRTRSVEFEARGDRDEAGNQDSMKTLLKQRRKVTTGAEFDLEDYWDEGEHLRNRSALPIGMTLNLVRYFRELIFFRGRITVVLRKIPPYSFLDASLAEEESISDHLHMVYSFPSGSSLGTAGILHGFQLSGPGEVPFDRIKPLLVVSCFFVLLKEY